MADKKKPTYRAITYFPVEGRDTDESVEVGAVWTSDKGDLVLSFKSGITLPRDGYKYKQIWLFSTDKKRSSS
jgi:hypothetical protein